MDTLQSDSLNQDQETVLKVFADNVISALRQRRKVEKERRMMKAQERKIKKANIWKRKIKRAQIRERKIAKAKIQGVRSSPRKKPIEVIDIDKERDKYNDWKLKTCRVFLEEPPNKEVFFPESNEIEREQIGKRSQEFAHTHVPRRRQTRSSMKTESDLVEDLNVDLDFSSGKRRIVKNKTKLLIVCQKCWGEYTHEYYPFHKCTLKKYPCKYCQDTCGSLNLYRKHVNTIHYHRDADDKDEDRMGYRCVRCKEWFDNTMKFKAHLMEGSSCRTTPVVYCRHCDHKTLNEADMNNHCADEHFDLGYTAQSPVDDL